MRRLIPFVFLATLARAASFVPVPIYPTGEQQVSTLTPALTMVCGRFVQPMTILSATKLAVNITTGYGAGKKVGFAIYPDLDGAGPIATSGSVAGSGTPPETAGIAVATGLTVFDLTGGVTYRVCFCATGTAGAYAGPKWTSGTGVALLQNAFVTSVGSATNPCSNVATPPSSTGALVADAMFVPPYLLVSSE